MTESTSPSYQRKSDCANQCISLRVPGRLFLFVVSGSRRLFVTTPPKSNATTHHIIIIIITTSIIISSSVIIGKELKVTCYTNMSHYLGSFCDSFTCKQVQKNITTFSCNEVHFKKYFYFVTFHVAWQELIFYWELHVHCVFVASYCHTLWETASLYDKLQWKVN